ncbi:DUF3718 domain-containing protein [Pseudoalteromonas sp. JBTF-M23]|uniref:DUF3718 domain-containing protein n=1 Tax=Pseudoalteromonas caenipelagi TaxID=2726988 RepID=A0A849V7I0_9GAMM|nr:DUF3718 domain-containing protein [Pseudoalteromonas caenipelagi]NOU49292.1 DUF3718 domain-containing protein [Pseudoalteromonas caenipelagi]
MKKLTTFCASATLLAGLLAGTANAEQFVAADNTIETELCMAITENDSFNLRKTMKAHRIGLRVMQNELTCNNMSADKFIAVHGFDNSAHSLNVDLNTETHIKDLSARHEIGKTIVVSGS